MSHAQDSKRKELENRRFELQQEIKRINALRTSNLKKQKSVLTQVEDLDTQISTTERLIKVTNQQANLLTRNINNNIKKNNNRYQIHVLIFTSSVLVSVFVNGSSAGGRITITSEHCTHSVCTLVAKHGTHSNIK